MADTNLLVLAREYKKLREEVKKVLLMPKGDKGDQGDKGEKGDTGDTGPQGFPGRDGKDGINGYDGKEGRNGIDGKDGKDGLDGVGVQNAYIDFDNSLVIVLTNGQEINAGFLSQETKDAVVATFKQGAATLNELLPVQTGNAGKFLTTDGTNTSWASLAGGLSYQGTWNASTNTPTLASGVGTNGYYYIVATAGSTNLDGITDWQIGDWLMFNGTVWQKIDQSNLVTSVNGQTGAVSIAYVDLAGAIPTWNQNTTGTAANVTGTVAIANGGTGSTTAAGALTNLGAYAASNPSGYITSSGTAANVSGVVAIANGGTGETTRQAAMDALAGSVTSGQYLRGNGTDVVMSAIQAADVPILNQNTTGTASNVTGIVAVANGGSGTATPSLVAGTNVTITGSWPNQTIAASGGGGGGSPLTISNKTAAYTVVAGDLGTIINCTSGTFTVSLTAAATLGSGFNVTIWNTGTGTITIDPNAAETIDGVATLVLRRGEGMQIVCDGTNFQTGDKKAMRGYAENHDSTITRPVASGVSAVAIGNSASAAGQNAVAVGASANASNISSFALIGGTASGLESTALRGTASGTTSLAIHAGTASNTYGVALGYNSAGSGATTVTGSGAMALGGSYASGVDSFAAGVGNNTASFGARGANSVAIGRVANASQPASIAIGDSSVATGAGGYCIAIGYTAAATGPGAVAIGNQYSLEQTSSTGTSSIAIGDGCKATQRFAVAVGAGSSSGIIGKFAHAGGRFAASGDAQTGTFVLRRATTDATATVLTTDNTAPGTDDQVILPNNSAYAFTGIVVARQQAAGGTASAAWKVEGLIRREGTAASTTLVASTVTAISNAPGWTLALSVDTTNGGLGVTFTGAAATNIRTVATIQTSEVTFA